MALTCNFNAPNGEPSDLSVALEQQFGAAQATEMMRVLYTKEALDKFNWVENTEFNTPKEELQVDKAIELYNQVTKKLPLASEAISLVKSSTLQVPFTTNENEESILDGSRNLLIRKQAIKGIEAGESSIIYVNGVPIKITNEGIRTSDKSIEDVVGLGYHDESAVVSTVEQEWLAGTTMNVYKLAPVYNLTEMLPKELIGSANTKIDQQALYETLKRIIPEILDKNDKPTKVLYSFEDYKSINDYVTSKLLTYLLPELSGMNGKVNIVNQVVAGLNQAKRGIESSIKYFTAIESGKTITTLKEDHIFYELNKTITPEQATEFKQKYEQALHSFSNIAKFTARSLQHYGVTIKANTLEKIGSLLKYDENPTTADTAEETFNLGEEFENYRAELDEGKSVEKFSDRAINISLHATASKNVKMFLAGITASEFGKGYRKRSLKFYEGKANKIQELAQHDAGKASISNSAALSMYREFKLETRKNNLGQPILVNYKDLFNKLLKTVGQHNLSSRSAVVEYLLAQKDPDLVSLGLKLKEAPNQVINELLKTVNNQYSVFVKVLFGDDNKRVRNSMNIIANKNNEIATIITDWQENQKTSKSVQMVNGQMVVNKKGANAIYKLLATHSDSLGKLKNQMKSEATKAEAVMAKVADANKTAQVIEKVYGEHIKARLSYETEEAKTVTSIIKFLDFLGITGITETMLRNMKGPGFKDIENSIKVVGDKSVGPISQLAETLKNATSNNETESVVLLKNGNPLYQEKSALKQLAKIKSQFDGSTRYATNHKSIDGETIQNFSLPSYLSDAFKGFQENTQDLLSNKFTQKAEWLLSQLSSDENSVKLAYLDGLIKNGDTTGITRDQMSPREQYLTPLLQYFNSSRKASFMDMTKSDKTMTPLWTNVEKLHQPKEGYSNKTKELLINIFKAEFERIQYVTNDNNTINDKRMAAGGGLFYFLPNFNHENMKKDLDAKRISQLEFNTVWDASGNINTTYKATTVEPLIMKYVESYLAKEHSTWLEKLKSINAIKQLPNNYTLTNLGFTKRFEDVNGKPHFAGYNELVNGVLEKRSIVQGQEAAAKAMIKEFSTQAFIMNTFSAMLVSGDPAIAYKGNPKDNVNAQVESTLIEYQKRMAKDMAPGAVPTFEPGSTFNSLVIEDPKMKSEMAKYNAKYKDADTVADAQELTTVREHLTVMNAEGKLPDDVYKGMIKVIDEGLKDPSKYYEFTDAAHKAVVLQAMKPVYVNKRFPKDGFSYYIDYIKSSSFPLLPEYTIGTELDKLRVAMEGTSEPANGNNTKGHINRVIFGSGKKLGQPVTAAKIWDNEGRIIEGSLTSKEFAGAQQTLSRDGFKIQQEVPYKGEKEQISIVSQADRFITSNIGHLVGFTMKNGTVLSGKELKALRIDTVREMSDRALEEFTNDIGGVEQVFNGEGVEVNSRLVDPDKFFDKLARTAEAKGYPQNDVDLLRQRTQDGRLKIPLWFSGPASKLESMVMSIIGEVTIPKLPGKSYVQASSIGIKRYATEIPAGKGIKFIKSFNPESGLQFMSKNDKSQSSPAQILVPFNFFNNGKRLKLEDFLDAEGNIDETKLPDEVLRIVGMRIPNQGHNSMLPMQIVGFLPESMGDLIVVPAEITTQMGSDFDVDKLYTYRANYEHNAQENTLATYKGEERNKQLQDNYFDVFWATLTHPDIFDRVTNPLDQPDMVEEKKLAESNNKNKLSTFFMSSNQIESYNAQKDAKRLVGLTALSGTLMADMEDMDVKLTSLLPNNYATFKDHEGNVIKLTKFSGVATSAYVNKDGTVEQRTKEDINKALQNEVLDYAKNRTIDALNINLKVYPAVDALINLSSTDGVSVGWSHIARFTQQPIIKEYVNLLSTDNDLFSEYYSSDNHTKVINELHDKYRKMYNMGADEKTPLIAFTPDELLQMISAPINSKESAINQLSILKQFELLHAAGTHKMKVQRVFNRAPRGPGANFIESMKLQDDANDLTQQFDPKNPTAIDGFEGMWNTQRGDDFKKTVGTAMIIARDVMPYNNIKPIIKQLAMLKGKESLSTEDFYKVNNALKAYMMSSRRINVAEKVNSRLSELLYDTQYQDSLAKRVLQAKGEDWGKLNFFISQLKTNVSTSISEPSTISYIPSETTSFEDEEVSKGMIEMMTGTDEQRTLIEDLIDYNYLSGSTGGQTSFNRFIPVSYIIGRKLDNNMRNMLEFKGWNGLTRNFIQQFLQHNPDFAPPLSKTLKGTINQKLDPDARNRINEALVLEPVDVNRMQDQAFRGNYPEYFAVPFNKSHLLYIKVEQHPNGETVYARLDLLGKGTLSEYNADNDYKRSLILNNKSAEKNIQFTDSQQVDPTTYIAASRTEIDDNSFYNDFVEIGKNETTALAMVKKISLEESPLLQVLKAATLQDVKVNANNNDVTQRGSYLRQADEIRLNLNNITGRAQLVNVFEHEYLHAVTARTLKDISSLSEEEATQKYGKVVYNAYLDLEVLASTLSDLAESDAQKYATSSIEELIAHAFTDKGIQKWLNETSDPSDTNLSGFDKFKTLITKLFEAIASSLGININKGSALEAIIANSGAIIGSNSLGRDAKSYEESVLGSVFYQDGKDTYTVPDEIKTAIKDILAHKNKLEKMQFTQSSISDSAREEFVHRGQEIDNLKADIQSLKTVGSFELLSTLGKRQMAWAKDVLARPSKSTENLMSAFHTAKTWSTLINNVYDGMEPNLVSDKIKTLQGEAAALEAQALVEFRHQTGIESEFTPEKLSAGMFAAYNLDLGQQTSKVAQVVYEKVSEQKKYRTEELRKFNKKATAIVDKVQKLAKIRGVKYSALMDKMLQGENDWGLVNRYSPELDKFKTQLESGLQHKLQLAYAVKGITQAQRFALVNKAKKEYKTKLERKMSYVNVAILLDEETGELLSGETVDRHKRDLANSIGADVVDDSIAKAQANYKKYLEEKDSYEHIIHSSFENYVMQIPTLFESEYLALRTDTEKELFVEQKTTEAEAIRDDKLRMWEGQNSPVVFYNMLAGKYTKGLTGHFSAYSSLVSMPKTTSTEFFDDKYKVLINDSELLPVYNFIQDTLEKSLDMLPVSIRDKVGDSFLPIIEAATDQITLSGGLQHVKQVVSEALLASQELLDRTQSDDRNIPLKYVKGKIDIDKMERDPMVLLSKFVDMALHFNGMSKVQAYAELAQQSVLQATRKTSEGKFAVFNASTDNLAKTLGHYLDVEMYQKARAQEGISKTDMYSLNPVKDAKIKKELKELQNKLAKLQEDYRNGNIEIEPYTEQMALLSTKIDEIQRDVKHFTASKLADVAIKYTQVKALAWNPMSAIANVTFGVISLQVHANARTDFDNKTMFAAMATMTQATRKAFGNDNPTAKKILALMDRTNLMGELLDSDHPGESKITARGKSNWKKVVSPYQMLRQSDYFMKGSIVVAMAKFQQVEVERNGAMVKMSLWDAMDSEGVITGNASLYNEADSSIETEFHKFRNRAVGVSKVIMGNQDSNSPLLIKKVALGRLATQFRISWLAEGMSQRLQDKSYNDQLGRDVKGRYRTYADIGIVSSMKMLLMQAIGSAKAFEAIDSNSKLGLVDKENMRKNLSEVAWYLTIMGITIGLSMLGDDDDKKNSKFKWFLLNTVVRTRNDISFFADPSSASDTLSNIIPASKVLVDLYKALEGTKKLMFDDSHSQFTGKQAMYRWFKVLPPFGMYPKLERTASKFK